MKSCVSAQCVQQLGLRHVLRHVR